MVRAVISDFGGVLTTPLIDSFLAYQDESGISIEELGVAMQTVAENTGRHPLYELEKGHMSERDFVGVMNDTLTAELGRPVAFHLFTDTYFAYLRPNDAMIAFLASLRRRGLPLALLTNNVREWEPRWRAMLPVDKLFDVIVDSAFVGTRKPERRIYELTLERLRALDGLADLDPADCAFVDDVGVNCAAASEFGFQTVRLEDTAQAIAELERLIAV